jgi:hypothetical protein
MCVDVEMYACVCICIRMYVRVYASVYGVMLHVFTCWLYALGGLVERVLLLILHIIVPVLYVVCAFLYK